MSARTEDPSPQPAKPLEVVIAGGGVAALEAALALHELAGDRVRLTLVAPSAEFVYRPMAVLEPFVHRGPRTLPLAEIAADVGATFERDTVAAVDARARVLHTGDGLALAYDALLIAIGARPAALLPGADSMDPARMEDSLSGLIEAIDDRSIHRLGFIAPSSTWPLPVYEVALLAKELARERDLELDVTVITAEQRPLGAFGDKVSSAVAGLLAGGKIELITGAWVHSVAGKLTLHPEGREIQLDRLVAVPKLMGPEVAGLPADADGFLETGADGRVVGVEHVYAAGDATSFPIKWGGIAAQQADAAAASIATLAGVQIDEHLFDGIVHGVLLASRGRERLYFSARIAGGHVEDSRVSDEPTSSPEAKIAAHYLGPYLDALWAAGPRWVAQQLSWEALLRRLEDRFGDTAGGRG
ncbi:MAG: FAD-dependent oxidoreductase [Solirubrobacteraceae bacterium]|jgi:sulfide:quinone oxidoreductase